MKKRTATACDGMPHLSFKTTAVTGIGSEKNICRRDPSDIIHVRGKYYVWYTKIPRRAELYPSGYYGSVWGAVSEDEGITWTELGEAIPKGSAGCFDSTSTFTPNILPYDGKYYLYYTAVGDRFDNEVYEDRGRTAIGVTVSDSPEGPWRKQPEPVLKSSRDNRSFDSFRIDDCNMVVLDSRILMFYKGRPWENTPSSTQMGVAEAETPLGPFKRLNDGNPVQKGGHEVLVFQHEGWMWSMVSPVGPVGNTLIVSKDPLSFTRVVGYPKPHPPMAPGLFRPELTGEPNSTRTRWGIAMSQSGGDPFLQRYEFELPPLEE